MADLSEEVSHKVHAYTAGLRWSAVEAYKGNARGSMARSDSTGSEGMTAVSNGAAEGERVYELARGVMDRLTFREALSAAHRRRRSKRRRQDESAELDDGVDVAGSGPGPRRGDDGDEGAAGGESVST